MNLRSKPDARADTAKFRRGGVDRVLRAIEAVRDEGLKAVHLFRQYVKRELKKMSQQIDDLNAKLDAQDAAISDLNAKLQAATAAITTEIQQLVDAISGGTANVAAIEAATGRISTANDGLIAASAALQAQTDALAADDPPTP